MYYPALRLDRFVSRRRIIRIQRLSQFLLAFTLLSSAFVTIADKYDYIFVDQWLISKTYGLFLLSIVLWVKASLFEAFYNSYFYKDINYKVRKPEIPYDVAHILYQSRNDDPLWGFIQTREGKLIMRELGIPRRTALRYLRNRKLIIPGDIIALDNDPHISLADYAVALYDRDTSFAAFLFTHGAERKHLAKAAHAVAMRLEHKKKKEQWWSRRELAKIPRLGTGWLDHDDVAPRHKVVVPRHHPAHAHWKPRTHADPSVKALVRTQLEKVRQDLSLRGINLVINDPLIYYVLELRGGFVRPMDRKVRKKIEQAIAWKMATYDIRPGSPIEFNPEDVR